MSEEKQRRESEARYDEQAKYFIRYVKQGIELHVAYFETRMNTEDEILAKLGET